MKFRGAKSLPPSIALWLEQQLELRGIDSVVYTRYIISLLNEENFDLNDLVTLNKGNKKLTSWRSCNLEDLKKTAVIECLTEAADQAFEIESLVDELCFKLKEAGNEEGDKCLKEKTNSEDIFKLDFPVSSLDLANKYYLAFPALSKGNSFENTFQLPTVWSKNISRILSNTSGSSVGSGSRRRVDNNCESSPKDSKILKRKENKENVLLVSGVCGGGSNIGGSVRRMRSRSTVKQATTASHQHHHHYRTRSSAKSLDRKEDEISTAMKRTYEAIKNISDGGILAATTTTTNTTTGFGGGHLNNFSGNGIGCSDDSRGKKCLNFMQMTSFGQLIGYPMSCGTSIEEFVPRRREEKISRTPGRKCGNVKETTKILDGFNNDCFDTSDELPMDFQQLLTSPSDVRSEFSLNNKRRQQCDGGAPTTITTTTFCGNGVGGGGPSSGNFIQCGTNITSSIWSDTSEKMEEDDNSGNSGNWENACRKEMMDNNSSSNSVVNGKWSDARNSILSSAWKLPFVYDKDIEGTSLAVNASTGSFYSFFNKAILDNSSQNDDPDVKSNISAITKTAETDSDEKTMLVGVNEKGDSNGTTTVEQDEDLLTSMRTHFRPIRNNDNMMDTATKIQDDTTTSVDQTQQAKQSKNNSDGGYKDGSTFTTTSASPMKLDYARSESGAFYLITTGEKYLEFKRTSPYYLSHTIVQPPQRRQLEPEQIMELPTLQTSSTFVPKFKVRQNEKFCQTDTFTPTTAATHPTPSLENEFFFPGDDRFAEEMLNNCFDDDVVGGKVSHDDIDDSVDSDDDDDDCFDGSNVTGCVNHRASFPSSLDGNDVDVDIVPRQSIQVSGWLTAWPLNMMDSNAAAIWSTADDNVNTKSWISCNTNNGLHMTSAGERTTCIDDDYKMDDRNEHYLRLRDELSEEGEELLSDLSSIHLFLDPERLDDPNSHVQNALKVESGGL